MISIVFVFFGTPCGVLTMTSDMGLLKPDLKGEFSAWTKIFLCSFLISSTWKQWDKGKISSAGKIPPNGYQTISKHLQTKQTRHFCIQKKNQKNKIKSVATQSLGYRLERNNMGSSLSRSGKVSCCNSAMFFVYSLSRVLG